MRLPVAPVAPVAAFAISLLATASLPANAAAQQAEYQPTLPAEGLYVATRRFGPDVRGTLTLRRDGNALHAEIAGHSVLARTSGDTIALALPDSSGWLLARRSTDGATITGHWIQPRIISSGQRYASPIVLKRDASGRWTGQVVPMEDAMTIYLVLRKRLDGKLGAFIRNPERNLGMQLRADRLELVGNDLRLLGKWNGRGDERVLGAGTVRERDFTLYIPGRGGSFDFRRIDEAAHTDFYPRGRPTGTYTYRQPESIADGWPTASLASVGLSTDSISRFVHKLVNQSMDSLTSHQVHAFLLARHGKLVVEEYFHGHNRDHPHDTRSAGKSFVSTLAGAAMHSRLPVSLSSRVFEVMNGGQFAAGIEPLKRTITLEHLLGMASGLDCDDSDPKSAGNESTITDQDDEPDYYKMILRVGTVREPGVKSVYCSASSHLAGGVIQTATRRSLPDLFQTLLAQPLGIERYYLGLTPTGQVYMGGGVRLSARSYAKIGQMYLDDGVWKGKRILDSAFVAQASRPRFDLAGIRYGLQWWVMDYPFGGRTIQGYFAGGNGGQLVMVIPALDMVVTFYGGNYADYTRTIHAQRNYVPQFILPAVVAK